MNNTAATYAAEAERGADASADFERPSEYDAMLAQGIQLSGEEKHFFIDGRLADLQAQLPAGFAPRQILDYGCGIGDTTVALQRRFRSSVVVGVDTAASAVASARAAHGAPNVMFRTLDSHRPLRQFDLCYVNGVFHHIEPADRAAAVDWIWKALKPGGALALFENNPWNPGTRMVMKRIPFDRDAKMLSVLETRRLLQNAGFRSCSGGRSLFYFPHALRAFRRVEPWLARVPFGAQYWVLAVK